jgi:hypothetical protein
MPTTGFHSEWITNGDNRVYVQCRAGFPGTTEHFIVSVACEFLTHNATDRARVVSIFYDNKACSHLVTVASTKKEDQVVEDALMQVLHAIYANGNCQVTVEIVAKGDEHSDHYDHMEHLSVATGVAVDRWRHSDAEYQADVSSPS